MAGLTFAVFGGFTAYSFRSENWDLSAANASYSFSFIRWGACLPNFERDISAKSQRADVSAMSTTYMSLANVNDSYISPQVFDNQPIQAYSSGSTVCSSYDNCTLPNGQPALLYETFHPLSNCMNPDYSVMYLQDIGVCMNWYNESYAKIGCFDSKGTYTAYYSDAACTNPVRVNGYRSSCAGSTAELHCDAPITPITSRQ